MFTLGVQSRTCTDIEYSTLKSGNNVTKTKSEPPEKLKASDMYHGNGMPASIMKGMKSNYNQEMSCKLTLIGINCNQTLFKYFT